MVQKGWTFCMGQYFYWKNCLLMERVKPGTDAYMYSLPTAYLLPRDSLSSLPQWSCFVRWATWELSEKERMAIRTVCCFVLGNSDSSTPASDSLVNAHKGSYWVRKVGITQWESPLLPLQLETHLGARALLMVGCVSLCLGKENHHPLPPPSHVITTDAI